MVSNVQTAGTILGTRETPGWKKAAIFLWENKTLTIGLVMLIVVVVCTVAAPLITTYGPNDQDIRNRLKPGFWSAEGTPSHPLGTDGVGRDLWSRIVYSFRTSLFIAICAVLITVAIGMAVALVSGTFGGWIDALLMRITEVQMAFPFIVLALAILSAVRPTPLVLIVVLSLSAWPFYARVIRSLIITEVQSDYVKAARVEGASTWRILLQYVARNVAPPVFVVATIDIATMIVLEGVLSFLGIGVQPPTPSFGNVIADGKDYLNTAWWVSTFPGIAIVFIVFAFNLVGDTLHKYIDPTLRTRYQLESRITHDEEGNMISQLPTQTNTGTGQHLLEVRDLKTYYKIGKNREIKAVEGLSFTLDPGQTLGIVGESGSGKSTVSRSLIRLVGKPGYIAGGQMLWRGTDLLSIPDGEMARLRGKEIGLIFQDPTTSLNPLLTVGGQLLETVKTHLRLSDWEARQRVLETLALVGIREDDAVFHKHPCDYSTGFRQRVMIAMSIVCQPDIVIADEPTTMLGVTVQAQILAALKELQRELGMAMILITHDFGVVSEISDRILVMYAGYAMEYAPKREFLLAPKHPYSVGLITSVPIIEARRSRRLKVIPGFPPDMLKLPPGCPFAPRCDYVQARCHEEMPAAREVAPGHWCACHFPVPKADLDLVEQLTFEETA